MEALRGIAALIVAYTHASYYYGEQVFGSLLFARVYVAVDLFFMLSGFVLARTYEGRMPGPLDFIAKRFARLWPLMAIGTALGAIYFALEGAPFRFLALQLAFGLLILPAINFYLALNPPAWSIFFELFANLMHSLVFQRVPTLVLLAIALLCAAYMLPIVAEHRMDFGQVDMFWLGFPRVVMSYLIGVVLYRWNGDRLLIPSSLAWPLLLSLPVLVAALSQVTVHWMELIGVLCLGPVMVLGALSLRNSRIALVLGAVSFPLYAVHVPVLWFAIGAGLHFMVAFAVSIIAGLAVGLALDKNCRAAFGFGNPGATERKLAAAPAR